MTAKFVNWSMATPNVGEPVMPRVWCVLKGLAMVSTIEMVLLAELAVSMAPVCGLIAREVGLTPTLTELPPPLSGLYSVMAFVPLELAKNTPLFVVLVATAGSKTMPVGMLETKPGETVVSMFGGALSISIGVKEPLGAEALLNWIEATTARP